MEKLSPGEFKLIAQEKKPSGVVKSEKTSLKDLSRARPIGNKNKNYKNYESASRMNSLNSFRSFKIKVSGILLWRRN